MAWSLSSVGGRSAFLDTEAFCLDLPKGEPKQGDQKIQLPLALQLGEQGLF